MNRGWSQQSKTASGSSRQSRVRSAEPRQQFRALDDEGADALPPAGARAYADRHGLVYVEGAELLARFG